MTPRHGVANGTVEHTTAADTVELVTLAGELGDAELLVLRRHLLEAVSRAPERLVIDLTDLTHVDASVLGMLADAARLRQPYGGKVVVVCPDALVARLIHLTALDHRLSVYASREAALADAPLVAA
jgi:anti-sigma B factor antagonist